MIGRIAILSLAAAALSSAGCASRVPETHYYRLAPPPQNRPAEGEAVLTIEELRIDAGYDDPRIVYRTSPYRLDYYHYHRWSAVPSTLVTDYLRGAYERSGHFRQVTSEHTPETTVVLRGRLAAIEEVDVTREHWIARVELELELRDGRTGELLWTRTVDEEEPLPRQHPEGVAAAVSLALERVAQQTAPQIAGAAEARLERREPATGAAPSALRWPRTP